MFSTLSRLSRQDRDRGTQTPVIPLNRGIPPRSPTSYQRLGSLTNTLILFDHHRSMVMPYIAHSPSLHRSKLRGSRIPPKDRRRQVRNEDLRTELDYYSQEYDEEREMEPRPARVMETTLVLRTRDASRVERKSDDKRPSERIVEEGGSRGGNVPSVLPTSGLFFHSQGGNPSFGGASTCHPYRGYTQQAPMSNYGPSHNGPMYSLNVPPTRYPFYAQPLNPLLNASMYPTYGPSGLFADSTGCVTPFVRWIEDYPLLDGLKMPSRVGFYDGKGDPENYLHLFEGSIREVPITLQPAEKVHEDAFGVTPGSVVVTTGSILVTPGSVITTGSILVTPGSYSYYYW
ncbi:hypothetical protein Tco_0500440 [Tanacetum coccineum]